MASGRIDRSDDWLPVRVRPVRGESFDSLCRRLAAANGITPSELLRTCMLGSRTLERRWRRLLGALTTSLPI